MSVFSKDASLVKGCLVLSKVSRSCVWENKFNALVPQVQLWRSILSSQRMPVLSEDASLVKGGLSSQRFLSLVFWTDTLGTGSRDHI